MQRHFVLNVLNSGSSQFNCKGRQIIYIQRTHKEEYTTDTDYLVVTKSKSTHTIQLPAQFK